MSILVSARGQQAGHQETIKQALAAWFAFLQDERRRARIMLIDAMGANAKSMGGAHAATRDYVGAIQAFIDLLYPGLAQMGLASGMMAAIVTGACIHSAKEWLWSNFETPMDTVVNHLYIVFEALDAHYRMVQGKLSKAG